MGSGRLMNLMREKRLGKGSMFLGVDNELRRFDDPFELCMSLGISRYGIIWPNASHKNNQLDRKFGITNLHYNYFMICHLKKYKYFITSFSVFNI